VCQVMYTADIHGELQSRLLRDNEKENCRILTNKEIYTILKKPTITETIRLHRLRWFGHLQ
jgi:hypothetical protein